ncbi:PAS domain-containing sensor histidine kinase [Sphingomonas hankyongi]|uniref:histidine kinase n=1 Tax=Sphingomonas hankyongi TaxID=2908209 RepID=A0ABT0S0A7_9SPHN|nr:PAS domain-containing sensor histidine kinase [Sphingomonas hankyongi]MCL6729256.1 PAS domain S-box protein [Sphingomonas hankyongi]
MARKAKDVIESDTAPPPIELPAAMFSGPGLLTLADLLPVMTAFVDRDLRYRFINKPLAEWLEQPRRKLIGLHMREVIGDEAFEHREPMLKAALEGERQFFASTFNHPARGLVAAQTDYTPWVNPGTGEVDGIVIVVTDITEQRVTERALRESEERFRRIANNAPALMWVTRLDRVRDFVNDAYCEFLGMAHEEARVLDWRDRIHPEDVDRIVAESIAGEAALQRFTLEGRYLRHDGEYRWIRSVSQPRFGPDGDLSGFIGVGTDITVRKEAELELMRLVEERTGQLAASEAQFRAVFEAALEVMVLLEPDGTVIAVNNRREIWRHPKPEDAIGTKLWDAPTMSAYPQHRAVMQEGIRAAARGEVFTTEVKMERERMPTAFLDVSVQPVRGPDGSIIYLLFEARDITELKTAQEQLRQSQKMEALGQLTGGIAHDFNNLLTVVVGGLDLIAKRADDAKLRRYAENALAAAERGARLTGQLLAFSRVQRLEVRPTQVAPLIESMRPLLRNVLGPGISKTFDLDEEMLPVMADPTQLEVAVLNLAINARDAMTDGGVLHFASRKVEVTSDSELEDGSYIELTISDTGAGMTEDVASRAFEPFFTTKEVGKGTGLGLSMVYGMARQSGGTARIESAPGLGTAVKMYFKAAEGATVADAAHPDREAEEDLATHHAASVLVIDDDPDVRSFIVATLEEQGYRVHEASDGRAGLAELQRADPDLVILDFIMPGLSGAEVASRILRKQPDLPILFVSGYSETEAVKRVAPHAPLLAKPFRSDALEKAVRGALAERANS